MFGQPEIQQLDAPFGDQDVGRLQIAMNDAFPMRSIQRIENLTGVFNGSFGRQRPFQRRALDVLHHQIVGAYIVHRANMGMIQRRDGAGLALEAVAESFLRNLDGNDAIEPRVTGLSHLTHAARANQCHDFVGAKSFSCAERHMPDSLKFTRNEKDR